MQVDAHVLSIVDDGLDVGRAHANRELGPGGTVNQRTRALLEEVLRGWPRELSHRFLWDFAEAIAKADVARHRFQHSDLTFSDIRDYLGESERFFNSWTHP